MARTRLETRARARALQALYAWEMRGGEGNLEQVATQVWDDMAITPEERRVAGPLVRFVAQRQRELDDELADGAMDALVRHGCAMDDVDVVWVPGAWELPAAARRAAATERYEVLVALGAVIRGDTPHFDFVAGEASRGLATAGADFDVPVAFGLLTCDTMAQAEARAGGQHGNKGWDAALAGLEMADLFDQIDGPTED